MVHVVQLATLSISEVHLVSIDGSTYPPLRLKGCARELAGNQTGFTYERSCVSSACANEVRIGCVRCLDSLCHSWHTKNRSTLHIYGPKSVLISSKLADQASYFFFGEYSLIFYLFLDNTCGVIGEICVRMPTMCSQFFQYFTYLSCFPQNRLPLTRRCLQSSQTVNFVSIAADMCNCSDKCPLFSAYIDPGYKVFCEIVLCREKHARFCLC